MTSIKPRNKLLLLGWDGADWNHINPLLDKGWMPNLESLINTGVMGNITTLAPMISPMLWNSVATGKLADEHGILGFTEPDPVNGGVRSYSSTSRKVKALWNVLSESSRKSIVVNWWASHPAEPIQGCVVTNAFTKSAWGPKRWNHPKGTFHPHRIETDLAALRVHLTEIDDQSILPFIPEAGKIDQEEDRRLVVFAEHLAQCASIQAAATHLMATESWDFTAVYFEGIDHFCHTFMEYQAPKMPHIRPEDYEMYKDVVDGAYRFHDMMLGAMLQLIDEDTYVILCSDHGFHSGNSRPAFTPNEPAGPAYWHRPLGIVAMKGPGLKQDERIYGASLVDIAPTALTLLGLPVGKDMIGKVLLDAFDAPPVIETIDSWEVTAGNSGMHPPEAQVNAKDTSATLLDQFVALGYIEDPGENKEEAARKTQIECDYNLAKTYLGSNRAEQALPIMRQLVEDSPWEHRFISHLARCYYEMGYLTQAANLIRLAFPNERAMPASNLAMLGRIYVRLGDMQLGEKYLKLAVERAPTLAGLHVEIGRTFLQKRDWSNAITACRRELEMHPNNASAYEIISSAQLRLGHNQEALDSALRAVAIQYWFPDAHLVLGRALMRLSMFERATQALHVAANMDPNKPLIHRTLASLYRRQLHDQTAAGFHESRAAEIRGQRRKRREEMHSREREQFDLPDLPSVEERIKRLKEERPRDKMGIKFKKAKPSGKVFTIVSGLPRSGTSLMMQLLHAGGALVQTDGEREADIDNPEGYYEWEAIKWLPKRPEILDAQGLDGKVIKVISMLLPSLPEQHQYKVVFMSRSSEEVAASQERMIDRLGTSNRVSEQLTEIPDRLRMHEARTIQWMQAQPGVDFVKIDFAPLIREPGPSIRKLVDFLGEDFLPKMNKMNSVVRPELYRQKSQQ